MMDYKELYELCDEIYDMLEKLRSKTENDYVKTELSKMGSNIEYLKGYIKSDEHDDTDATLRDVGRWLDAQQRVS